VDRVVALLLADDCVSPTRAAKVARLSDRASRRLFERLVELGAVLASPATENEAERPSCGPHTTVQLADPKRFIGTKLLEKRFAFGDLAFRQGSGGASGFIF
jgi:Protein of unknown function (DUF1403)